MKRVAIVCTALGRRAAAGMVIFAGTVLPAAASPTLGLPPLTEPPRAQVALGRALFFDRRLSLNGTLSCAMCHLPEQGFTANELRTSVGMEGVSLRRNAPTLLNVAFQRTLFHDGRAASLEEQALMPLLHPDEMANPSVAALVSRTAALPGYARLFNRAFGDPRPSGPRIARALAAYQRTLLAGDSPFDRWHFGGDAAAMPADARRGYVVFRDQGCIGCHRIGERDAMFTDHAYHNTGVGWRSEQRRREAVRVQLLPGLSTQMSPQEVARVGLPEPPDQGRFEATRDPRELRAIRTPTLRNVALTAPYMHDGSFDTLEQVVDHYADGGSREDPAQDPRIRPLTMNADDRRALVAFLRALTSARLPGRDDDAGAPRTGRR